jgi:glycosyltransferase involved in cell wall biosynthesis
MRKHRVLYLVEDLGLGGLERVVEILYKSLSSDRYEPHIWCLAKGGVIERRLNDDTKRVRILKLRTYHNPLNFLKLAYLLRKGEFSIVHTHGYFAGTIGTVSSALANIPIKIAHVHTTYFGYKKRHLFIERLLSRLQDRIICCSDAVADFLRLHVKIKKEKVLRIYNGLPCAKTGSLQAKSYRKSNYVNIGIIGSLVENKGHIYLLKSIEKLAESSKEVRLHVVGDGPTRDQLTEFTRKAKLEKHVSFLGRIEDIDEILENLDICVLTSIEREGLGNSLIEAMCKSIPVVGSEIGGIPEIIKPGSNGFLVLPKDPDDIEYKLRTLVKDKELRKKMGANGKKIFDRKFSITQMMGQIEDLYDTLINAI